SRNEALTDAVRERFGDRLVHVPSTCGEVTFEAAPADLLEIAATLRDDPAFAFEMLIDLCGVDYLTWGEDEWETRDATRAGFSRAVEPRILADPGEKFPPRRFCVVYHLLSVSGNRRLRLKVYTGEDNPPVVPS